jgi:urea carboxylase
MEGPGGYQFVGRTTQVWNHLHPRAADSFEPGTPWLLRCFDRISFFAVSAAELLELRAEMAAGRGQVDIATGEFALADYRRFLDENSASIAGFRRQQAVAFAAERHAWDLAGEFAGTRAS